MRARNLPHRASFIFVHNSAGALFVQQRVAWKETYPSHYDPAPVRAARQRACIQRLTRAAAAVRHQGGVVDAGESYEDNAVREVAEEMGVVGGPRLSCHVRRAADAAGVGGCGRRVDEPGCGCSARARRPLLPGQRRGAGGVRASHRGGRAHAARRRLNRVKLNQRHARSRGFDGVRHQRGLGALLRGGVGAQRVPAALLELLRQQEVWVAAGRCTGSTRQAARLSPPASSTHARTCRRARRRRGSRRRRSRSPTASCRGTTSARSGAP